MADTLQDRYDDESLSCIVQPIPLVYPWLKTPQANEFPSKTLHRTVPVIEWVVEMFEDDARLELISYLGVVLGKDYSQPINALPGSYLSFLYRNVFSNLREDNDAVLPIRIDHQFASPLHAIPAAWVAYYMAGMFQQPYVGATDNEGMYRFKLLTGIQECLGTYLNAMIAANPTLKKDTHLIICNTQVSTGRPTLYVDLDLLNKYLSAGGTLKALCDNWINTETNPTP